jgi:peptide deformylase
MIMGKHRKESKYALLSQIRQFNHPALKVMCDDTDFTTAKPIFRQMMKVLAATKTGIGLAANQIGETIRVIVIRPNRFGMTVMVNPCITFTGSDRVKLVEGCLSYPNVFKGVERSTFIKVNYINETGDETRDIFEDLAARIIQHELDHLNGKCALA